MTVICDGKKVQEQCHYLAYALYKEEIPDDKVSLSMFEMLRPDTVLCKDNMPHNLCVSTMKMRT